jgi:hypothetical protein
LALTPISGRPGQPAVTPPAAGEARAAAQRAFFQTALAKAGAPAATAQTAAPAPVETRALQPAVTRVQDETTIAPQPTRILRPGSLLDIKV